MPPREEHENVLARVRRTRDRVARQAWERFRCVKRAGATRSMPRSVMVRLATAELLATRARALVAMLREGT